MDMKLLKLLFIFLNFTIVFSQKTVVKSKSLDTDVIVINLDNIDNLSIVCSNTNTIQVVANEMVNEQSFFTISTAGNTTIIESFQKNKTHKAQNVCFEQPLLTTYKITIPENKKVEINIKIYCLAHA